MKNDKLILCLFGSLILSACVSNPLSSSDDDGISAIKMASHAKCMDEIETNPTWVVGSKLLSEDQKQKKKREEIYQRIQHERAMHEHLQHLDQDYQPAFEDEGAQQNNFNR